MLSIKWQVRTVISNNVLECSQPSGIDCHTGAPPVRRIEDSGITEHLQVGELMSRQSQAVKTYTPLLQWHCSTISMGAVESSGLLGIERAKQIALTWSNHGKTLCFQGRISSRPNEELTPGVLDPDHSIRDQKKQGDCHAYTGEGKHTWATQAKGVPIETNSLKITMLYIDMCFCGRHPAETSQQVSWSYVQWWWSHVHPQASYACTLINR